MDAGGSRAYTTTWRVRSYELDANGHVNNSVYVAYAEEVANQHAEALGFGRAWTQEQAGAWVVRHHEITYFLAATYGDELELTTEVAEMRGARAIRKHCHSPWRGRQPGGRDTHGVEVDSAPIADPRIPGDGLPSARVLGALGAVRRFALSPSPAAERQPAVSGVGRACRRRHTAPGR